MVSRPLLNRFQLILLGFLLAGQAAAESSVWKATKGGNTIYLGGTVHLLRPSDYPLPPEYDDAYQASDELVFETDISALSDLSVQTRMLQQLTYSDGRSLKTVLSAEAYAALGEAVATFGMPLMMLESFKPGMVVSTLQVLSFQQMGFTPQGVDAYFNSRAIGDGKRLGKLETVDEQIGFLAAMGEGNESEFIMLSLRDLEDLGAMMDDMIGAWRTGDAAMLGELFVDDMASEAPALYDSLLLSRNRNWLPQLETMATDPDTEFVLVGAAHLVGNDGLIAMLRDSGFEVSKL